VKEIKNIAQVMNEKDVTRNPIKRMQFETVEAVAETGEGA
jgi:hypothetical protein